MEFECKRSSTVSHFQACEHNRSHSTLEYKFPMTCTVHTIRTFFEIYLSCACAFTQLKFPCVQFALLQCSLIGVSSKRYGGGSTVLTSEERESVMTCEILAEMGFPLTKAYVEVVVRDSQKSRPH